MLRLTTALASVAVLALTVMAADTPKAAKSRIGMAAPSFAGLEGTDGKSYGLDSFKEKDVLVVCITCNHCPVAVEYEDRNIEFAKKYAGDSSKVGFIAINVNNGPNDRLDKMKERAKEKGFNFPYAYDPSQKIARELGAKVTPEYFVFNKDRKLVYTGPLDDNRKPAEVKNRYLADAVEAALKGEAPKVQEQKPFGCGVKYDKN